MNRDSRFNLTQAVLSFMAVMALFLIVADMYMASTLRTAITMSKDHDMQDHMFLVGLALRDPLSKGDYATVWEFLDSVVSEDPELARISLTSPDGTVLALHQRDEPARVPIKSEHEITYPEGTHAILSVEYDLYEVEREIDQAVRNTILTSIAFTLLIGLGLWLTIRKTAITPLTAMYAEVLGMKESLQETIQQRTADLAEANRELEEEISQRREAQRRLLYSETYLRSIFDANPECVKLVGPDAGLIEMNPAGLQMLGFSPKENLKGTDTSELVAPEHRDAYLSLVKKVCNGENGQLVFETLRPDGGKLLMESRAVPFYDTKQKRLVMLSVTRDITRQRRLEEQLQQAQKMELIGSLTGGVAHEFNNILTAILGYGEFLEDDLPAGSEHTLFAQRIVESAKRAADLTQGLLAFSRRQILKQEKVSANQIITRTQSLLNKLLGENYTIRINLAENNTDVFADKVRLEHALLNLGTNARDAMADGGSLTIGTQTVVIDDSFINKRGFGRPGRYVKVSVSDTGRGIRKADLDRIYEPFFTTKGVGRGTGLGLSMVYGIVKQHEGFIDVRSQEQAGTTFHIYLPAYNDESTVQDSSIVTGPEGGSERILLAEDDTEVRAFLTETLTRAGYTVYEATNGQEAKNVFRDTKDTVDLLLFDVIMPVKNGRDAAEEILTLTSSKRLKVIFMSGYSEEYMEDFGGLSTDFSVVEKPVSSKILLGKIRRVLDDN